MNGVLIIDKPSVIRGMKQTFEDDWALTPTGQKKAAKAKSPKSAASKPEAKASKPEAKASKPRAKGAAAKVKSKSAAPSASAKAHCGSIW